jgi:hypothetical protein
VAHALEDCDASGWRLSPEQCSLLEEKVRFHRHGWFYDVARYCKRYVTQSLGRGLG